MKIFKPNTNVYSENADAEVGSRTTFTSETVVSVIVTFGRVAIELKLPPGPFVLTSKV